jgi:hypothetical protein
LCVHQPLSYLLRRKTSDLCAFEMTVIQMSAFIDSLCNHHFRMQLGFAPLIAANAIEQVYVAKRPKLGSHLVFERCLLMDLCDFKFADRCSRLCFFCVLDAIGR